MPAPADAPTSAADAHAAVERATGNLTESYQRWPRVHKIVAGLDAILEENHLGEKITEAYRSR